MSDAPLEFPRPVPLDRIGPAWQSHRIEADAGECAALAKRFDLVAVASFQADIRLRRIRAGRYIEAEGQLYAAVVQSCIVSLEPVAATVEEPFRELFGPIGGADDDIDLTEISVELDAPEPLDGPTLDLGEIASQHLALSLDPYPRAAGATTDGTPGLDTETSPFAALASRKPQQ